MKVAIIDSYFSVVDLELQRALESAGIDAWIISSTLSHIQYRKNNMKFDYERHNQVFVRAFESIIPDLNLYFPFPVLLGLDSAIKQIKPDVIQTTEHVSSPTLWCSMNKKHWKTVLLERAGEWNGIVPKFKIHEFLAKKLILPKVDIFAGLSSFAAEYLRYLGCTKEITLIPNPVDTEMFRVIRPWDDRKNIVLYVGRLIKRKLVDVIIKAMPAVKSKIPDAELWLIGDGPDEQYLRALANGKEYIKFLGSRPRSQLTQYYNQSKVFIMLTDRKATGIGMSTEEAMSCGVPVISTPDLPFDERDDVYYAATTLDPADLARSISAVLSDGHALANNAAKVAQRVYSHTAVGKKYRQMLEAEVS